MDILIVNVYRTVRHPQKPINSFCMILKISMIVRIWLFQDWGTDGKMVKHSFRKDSSVKPAQLCFMIIYYNIIILGTPSGTEGLDWPGVKGKSMPICSFQLTLNITQLLKSCWFLKRIYSHVCIVRGSHNNITIYSH